jgi:hypothetical protein
MRKSAGVPAITTPFAPCAIRKSSSAPPIAKASSPSISRVTAANSEGMLAALGMSIVTGQPTQLARRRAPDRNGNRDEYAPLSMPSDQP